MNRCSQKTLFKEVGFSVLLELLASLTTTGSSHGSGLCDHQDPEVHRSINGPSVSDAAPESDPNPP